MNALTRKGVSRLFLAIEPHEEIIREINVIQKRLQKSLAGDIRWTRPEGMHLTLKFLGDVFDSQIAKISDKIGALAAQESPFTLSLGKLGAFPSLRRPRVLHVEIKDDEKRLPLFQASLEETLAEEGFAREERAFTPHLTLARVKALRDTERFTTEMTETESQVAGTFTARTLFLFKSDLTPQGAIYTKLAAYPFARGTGHKEGGKETYG